MYENIPAFLEHDIISILESWFKPYPRFYIICSDINCKHEKVEDVEKVEDAVLIDYNFNELPHQYGDTTLRQGKQNIHDILDNKLVSLCLKKEDGQINRIKELDGDRFYIKFYDTESYVFVDIMRKN